MFNLMVWKFKLGLDYFGLQYWISLVGQSIVLAWSIWGYSIGFDGIKNWIGLWQISWDLLLCIDLARLY